MSQSLVVRVGADITDFQRQMKGMNKSLNQIGDGMISLGKDLTKSVTAPLMALGGASAAAAITFEASMSKVATTVGDASNNMDELANIARSASRTSIFSSNQIAEAMSVKGLAGLNTIDIYNSMTDTINLATSANMSLATATGYMTDVMGVFGKTGEEAALIADMMTSANKTTALTIGDIRKTMLNAGSAIANYGISLEHATAMTVMMGDASLVGAKAGTAMRAMFDDLAQGAVQNADAFQELGIRVFDSNGNMLPAMDIVKNLRNALGDMNDVQRTAALYMMDMSVTGQKALMPMLNATDERLNYLTGRFEDVGGAAAYYARIMEDNVKAQMKIFMNNVRDMGITIGNTMLPAINEAIQIGQSLASMFADNLTPEMASSIVEWGLLAASIGPVLILAGKAIKTFAMLKTGFMAVKAGATLTSVALGGKGLTPIVGALAAKTVILTKKVTALALKAFVPLAIKMAPIGAVIVGIAAVAGVLANVFGVDLSGAVRRLADMFPGLARTASNAMNTVRTGWERLRNFMRNPIRGAVNIAQRFFGGGAGQNANGTSDWQGGATWVNERGPELINLPEGSQVVPYSLSRLMSQEAGREMARNQGDHVNNSNAGINYERMFDGATIIWKGADDIRETMREIAWVTQTEGARL